MTDKPTDLRAELDACEPIMGEATPGTGRVVLAWEVPEWLMLRLRDALLPPGDEPVYAVTERALAAAILNVGISELDWHTSQIVKGEDEHAGKLAAAILRP